MGKQLWMSRADVFQDSLDALFAAPKPQYLHNRYPSTPQDDELFNYWWLAHGIDCRLDAYHRSGDTHRLEQAVEIHNNIIERNHGSLFNDYFDDMLWFALSTLRLHEATHDDQYRDEATQLWNHVIKFGWNDVIGPSLSWRKQQPYYKNTPANAPLSILGARLYMLTGEERYIEYAQTAFDWITHTLVRPNGFVSTVITTWPWIISGILLTIREHTLVRRLSWRHVCSSRGILVMISVFACLCNPQSALHT